MHIVIDMLGAQTDSRFRGIGRYSLSLAQAMARNAGEHEIWLMVNGAYPESIENIKSVFSGLVPPERILEYKLPEFSKHYNDLNNWQKKANELIREYFIQQLHPDVLHVSSLFEDHIDSIVSIGELSTNIFTAVTLYDLIPYLDPDNYLSDSTRRESYFRKISTLKKANLILSISNSSRKEAVEKEIAQKKEIVNISSAIDESFKHINIDEQQICNLKSKFGIEREIIMYAPGGFDTRKNFDGLISAYGYLSTRQRERFQLVIVSKVKKEERKMLDSLREKAGLSKDEIVITGYVTDEDLIELYNIAYLFIFASKHEGFGLPVLEAMACGAPVIGSNRTSIPEIIQLESAMFDPFNVEDISKKLEHALDDEKFRSELIKNSADRLTAFSWDNSAVKALACFEKMYDEKKHSLKSSDVKYTEFINKLADASQKTLPLDSDLILCAEAIEFNDRCVESYLRNKQVSSSSNDNLIE